MSEQLPVDQSNPPPEWLKRRLEQADDSNAGAAGGFGWSCFVCGRETEPQDVAVAHLTHAGVVCCVRCKGAADTQHIGPASPAVLRAMSRFYARLAELEERNRG